MDYMLNYSESSSILTNIFRITAWKSLNYLLAKLPISKPLGFLVPLPYDSRSLEGPAFSNFLLISTQITFSVGSLESLPEIPMTPTVIYKVSYSFSSGPYTFFFTIDDILTYNITYMLIACLSSRRKAPRG